MDEHIKRWHEKVNLPKLLLGLGEDLGREGLLETPDRIRRAWLEFLGGYSLRADKILGQTFEADADGTHLQVCRDITFTSMCEHHLLPFIGVCHIGYVSAGRVVGLSKLARLVDCFARRLQIQERMTTQIANALYEHLEPKGVLVIVEAKHLCCHGRGIRRQRMEFVTATQKGTIDKEFTRLLMESKRQC